MSTAGQPMLYYNTNTPEGSGLPNIYSKDDAKFTKNIIPLPQKIKLKGTSKSSLTLQLTKTIW